MTKWIGYLLAAALCFAYFLFILGVWFIYILGPDRVSVAMIAAGVILFAVDKLIVKAYKKRINVE